MKIDSGDCFFLPLDGKQIQVQAICSHDAGHSWICSRSDGSPSDTTLLLTAKELLASLSDDTAETAVGASRGIQSLTPSKGDGDVAQRYPDSPDRR